jgi:hypothetical protein
LLALIHDERGRLDQGPSRDKAVLAGGRLKGFPDPLRKPSLESRSRHHRMLQAKKRDEGHVEAQAGGTALHPAAMVYRRQRPPPADRCRLGQENDETRPE